MSNSIIEELNKNLIEQSIFRIPLYQRPYSWKEENVEQLLIDLYNHENTQQKYFVGNIVLSKDHNKTTIYDIIDGQQRLTTIFLISVLAGQNNPFLKLQLSYEIRTEDDKFLDELREKSGKFDDCKSKDKANLQFTSNIKAIKKFLTDKNISENCQGKSLSDLLNKVNLVFTILPKNTDITKYFEIMNNRGKQLEKHQILKAKFLHGLNEETGRYAKIWDACSNMNVYLEDFLSDLSDDKKTEVRKELLMNFSVNINESDKTGLSTISGLLKQKDGNQGKENNSGNNSKEYSSIVKFPIFLLHCLKLYNKSTDITLDDNKLIKHFEDNFFKPRKNQTDTDKKDNQKYFMDFMLKQRILFDYFIFKRDVENKKPFFEEVTFNDNNPFKENNELLMIQLLFNINSSQSQEWLSVVLKWLNDHSSIDQLENKDFYSNYLKFLECIDRELAKVRLNGGLLINKINSYLKQKETTCDNSENFECKLSEILHQGTSTPHYWFYKLDYLLWKECNKATNSNIWSFENKLKFSINNQGLKDLNYDIIKSHFRLSRLNSIEHIHPQSKKDDWKDNNGECKSVDCFGNLALISNHMNSTLNAQENHNKKQDIQKQLNNGTIESLKMIFVYSKYSEWNPENCEEHQKEMIKLLCDDLKGKKDNNATIE